MRVNQICISILLASIFTHVAMGESPALRVGSSHAAGRYYFTNRDYLNEGAIEVANSGMRVIKVWFDQAAGGLPWNSRWPQRFGNYIEIARHPYFQELFNRPFDTYVLTIFDPMNYQDGFADPRPAELEQKFYELAKYLLATYRGTGKTFILAHHEGDWHLRPGGTTDQGPAGDATPTNIKGMIRWLNARQAGTDRARREVKETDVKVYHAVEVNLVAKAMEGRPSVTNDVLPHTHCDLVSYSAWDTTVPYAKDENELHRRLRAALEYLADKMPDSSTLDPTGKPFGNKNIFISEYGLPEEEWAGRGEEELTTLCRGTVEAALAFGCRYVIYWQVFCNECCIEGKHKCEGGEGSAKGGKLAKENNQCRGFWLRRVDGSFSPAWTYFTKMIGSTVKPPVDFSAAIDQAGAVSIKWSGGPPEARYRIERSENGSPFRLLSTPAQNVTTHHDSGVQNGLSYRYRIRSEAGPLTSGWFYADPQAISGRN